MKNSVKVLAAVGCVMGLGAVVGMGQVRDARNEGRRVAIIADAFVEGQGLLPSHTRERVVELMASVGDIIKPRLVSRVDQDGDGVLSITEQDAVRSQMREITASLRASVLAHHDLDMDGELNESERGGVREMIRERISARRDAADRNGDGSVSDAEIREAASQVVSSQERSDRLNEIGIKPLLNDQDRKSVRMLAGEIVIEVRSGLLEAFDANRDGLLDGSERDELRQRAQERMGEIKKVAVAAGDVDGSGTLSREERRALMGSMALNWLGLTREEGLAGATAASPK